MTRLHFACEGEWLRADGQGYELRPVCGNDFHGRKKLTEDPAKVSCRECLTLCGFDAVPDEQLTVAEADPVRRAA